jgi:TatD DNase family protein
MMRGTSTTRNQSSYQNNRGGSSSRGGGSSSRGGGNFRSSNSSSNEQVIKPETPIHHQPLCDIGANLTNFRFKDDIKQVLQRCVDTNVNYVFITGTSEQKSRDGISFVKRHRSSFPKLHLAATVGVHPHDAKTCNENTMGVLESMITKEKGVVYAVGETGLDFNRMFSPQETQELYFKKHIELAIKHKLPLFLHERDAHESFVNILKQFKELTPVVVHCFTGTAEECKKYVDMGFYIGFTGTISMGDRGKHLRDLLSDGVVPHDRIMIETDAPFMAPDRKIKRMEPCYLSKVARTLATVLNLTEEQVAKLTTDNAKRFFNIQDA